jgi:signal transduction histidine kinase
MLNKLRLKLTFNFFISTFTLILIVGSGSYYVLQNYLLAEIDLALAHGMAGQFLLYNFEFPQSLTDAEEEWVQQQARLTSNISTESIGNFPNPNLLVGLVEEAEEEGEDIFQELSEHGYGTQQISIFTMPLDDRGKLIFNPNPYPLPMAPDKDGYLTSLKNGYDVRTIKLASGQQVRLLTYITVDGKNPAAFQLGRIMVEQVDVLNQLFFGILVIGSLSLFLLGLGSWRLAGSSLRPAQIAMDQQQAFIANASHELRTPLTLIRASTEMAIRKTKDKNILGLLNDVIDESDYMKYLVNDLLLLSRMDAHKIELSQSNFNIPDLFDGISKQVNNLAKDKNIKIIYQPISISILADETRLKQVLLILLSNAITYTPNNGEIMLSAVMENQEIIILVKDNGEGISAEHLPHIFDRFYQAKASFSSKHRGNGLGLSIAKTLIELHQGKIIAESEVDIGTAISIILPNSIIEN